MRDHVGQRRVQIGSLGERAHRPGPNALVSAREQSCGSQIIIYPPNPEEDAGFGFAVSLWENTLAVGVWHEDVDELDSSGAVYVFTRDTGWSYKQLVASNARAADEFGYAVSLWGDTLAVGAINEDNSESGVYNSDPKDKNYKPYPDNDVGSVDSGAVYIFR